MSKRFLSGINVTGTAALNTVANAGLDTDKFLVLDAAGNVDFRTGDELKLDIGADVVSKVQHEVKLGETMTIGTPVYIGVDLNAGTNMTVYKATNATEAGSSKTIGLIASSGITNDLVQVVTEGLLAGLNTSTATKGDPVWLGVNGALLFGLANKPVAPAHMVFLGIVTRVQQNNGEIFVKVQNGFEMNEIHNYLQGSVQNNEVIVYESATSLYKPKSIPTILGYTPADDASVVRITGAQTVGGLKTFSASIVANIGVLLKNGAVSALNGYTAIGGSSSNGIELVFSPGGSTQSLLFQTSAAYSYTFPAATGTVALISDIPSLAGYVPNTRTLTINGTTYDLSANRSWTITTDASARSILRYVATANQTTFTISGGYTPGLTDVYRNGVKLDNTTDFTATNGTTIVLTNGASVNDVIEVYRYQTAFLANNALRVVTEFVATAGQTTFNVTYNSGLVDVFYNGSKLLSTEYTAGNGTSIILNFPCNVNDTLEVHAYSYQVGAFSGQAQLNGTGLVRMSGTTVTYDNATYATQSYVTTAVSNLVNAAPSTLDTLNELAAALGNDANFATTVTTSIATRLPLTGGTLTGNLNGTSATFSSSIGIGSGTNPNDILHIIKSGTTTYAAMRVNNNNSTAELYVGVGGSAVVNTTLQNNAYIMNAGASGLALGTSDIIRMFITTGGNVGIRNNNAYSPLTVTGTGISWGETVTYYPASNGYITVAFRLEGTDTTTGTWAIGKQSTIENGGVQYLQIAKNGLTGSTLHRPDAVQSFDPANGNAYFGFNVGIGTTSPFNFGSIHRTLDVRGSGTSSIGALFVGNSNRSAVLGFYINPAAAGTVGTSSNHALQLVTNDIERVRIGTNGNVGIANDNPLCRLHIGPEGSVGGNSPTILMSSPLGTKPAMLITEYTARSGAIGYDSSNFLTLATETGVTAGIKLKVGSSFGGGLLNTGTDAIIINTSGQVQRPNQPAFLAYSSGFTVTGGIWQLISNNINTETYDIGSNYSSGRFTAPVSGRYLFYFGGWANISSNNGDRYAVSFSVNGGGYLHLCGGNYSTTDSPLSGATIVHNLNAGDYVELYAFSIIGGTWGGGHSIWWGGYLL